MTGSLIELDDFGEEKTLQLKNLFLPAVVLGIRPIAVIVQLVRTGIIDVLNEEYIKTAYAKGLSSFQVVYKHAIKNILNPVITAVSGWFASMLAGAVFVEYIFGWRGLGKEIVNALNNLDIPVVMGAVLVISCLFVLINIIVDLLYMYIDPKAKPF
jgi:peptide/nickel transport system permease protein